MEDRSFLDVLRSRHPDAVCVSARTRSGLADLVSRVAETLSRSFLDVEVDCNVGNGRVLSQLAARSEVISRRYTEGRAVIHCRISPAWLSCLEHEEDVEVRLLGPLVREQHSATAD